jgi:muramoyltetrapeptide carboxypeptidase
LKQAPIRPPRIKPGSRVSLVAPAGPLTSAAVDRAIRRVRELGWEPEVGEHARGRHGYLSGTDEERIADLNTALRSAENDVIWCLRGGYGVMRIADRVDWDALRNRPRALIGFSDNTVLHLAAARRGILTFHGPHPASAELSEFSVSVLTRILVDGWSGEPLPLPVGWPSPEPLHGGAAEGPLVGGNLSLLAATLGTPFEVPAEGAILFIEEVGEPAYRIDRLLSQLRLARIFDRAAGIVLGGFGEGPDEGQADIPSAVEVVRDRLHGLRIPVLAGLPFGHIPDSWTLPIGVRARLDADAGEVLLLDPAVCT